MAYKIEIDPGPTHLVGVKLHTAAGKLSDTSTLASGVLGNTGGLPQEFQWKASALAAHLAPLGHAADALSVCGMEIRKRADLAAAADRQHSVFGINFKLSPLKVLATSPSWMLWTKPTSKQSWEKPGRYYAAIDAILRPVARPGYGPDTPQFGDVKISPIAEFETPKLEMPTPDFSIDFDPTDKSVRPNLSASFELLLKAALGVQADFGLGRGTELQTEAKLTLEGGISQELTIAGLLALVREKKLPLVGTAKLETKRVIDGPYGRAGVRTSIEIDLVKLAKYGRAGLAGVLASISGISATPVLTPDVGRILDRIKGIEPTWTPKAREPGASNDPTTGILKLR